MTAEERPAPWDDLRAIAGRLFNLQDDIFASGRSAPSWLEPDGCRLRDIAEALEDQYEHMRDHQ